MALTWVDFLKELSDKYMPVVYKNKKKLEFLKLKQNDLVIVDYKVQFVRLSKDAPKEVATSDIKREIWKGIELGNQRKDSSESCNL